MPKYFYDCDYKVWICAYLWCALQPSAIRANRKLEKLSILLSKLRVFYSGIVLQKGTVTWVGILIILVPLHSIKAKWYHAQESSSSHSGLDSKAMHSFTTQKCFPQSSVMTMYTYPVNSIWSVEARYGRQIHWSWLFQPHG